MLFGGIIKTSLIDFPGKVACTVFTVGCNLRCPYCHNPELVLEKEFNKEKFFEEIEILRFLKKRKGLLDGICITGGEPTLYSNLIDFIRMVKNLGFLVKLDTNGTNSQTVKKLIDNKLVDYIAMDIKAPLNYEDYQRVGGNINEKTFEEIKKTTSLIMNSGIDYEFRTTVLPKILSKEDIKQILKDIKGARAFYIQNFIPSEKLIDQDLRQEKGYTRKDLLEIQKLAKRYVKYCGVR